MAGRVTLTSPCSDGGGLGRAASSGTNVVLIERHLWRYAIYRAWLSLIGEASRYYLGWMWWFLEPLAMTSVFFVVFTYLRPANVEHFTHFLIIGVTTWLWFANGVGNSTDALAGAKAIISQMRLPKLLFPIVAVCAATLKQGFVFAILFALMGGVFGVNAAWLALPLLALTQLTLILAFAATVALACCWIRDLRFIVRSGLTLMMFCSGVFFDVNSLPERMEALFRLNPMVSMIEQYRTVLLAGAWPDVRWCLMVMAAGALWLHALRWTYERLDLNLTRKVIA